MRGTQHKVLGTGSLEACEHARVESAERLDGATTVAVQSGKGDSRFKGRLCGSLSEPPERLVVNITYIGRHSRSGDAID